MLVEVSCNIVSTVFRVFRNVCQMDPNTQGLLPKATLFHNIIMHANAFTTLDRRLVIFILNTVLTILQETSTNRKYL